IDIDCLPIPDWGLRCPRCDAPLAGMSQHRCRCCGHAFNIRHLLGRRRPIPDLGLTCPECGYLLTGLMEERCPECGKGFSVRAMLEDSSRDGAFCFADTADPDAHHIKKREPTLSGSERPMPDFGLVCSSCDHPLAGATEANCPRCGEPFALCALVPDRDWLNIADFVPRDLRPLAKTIR
ncbi:MAG: hypothetical protein GY778_08770, partial [bacterium]|nr:hypothetical protein [bacterium]